LYSTYYLLPEDDLILNKSLGEHHGVLQVDPPYCVQFLLHEDDLILNESLGEHHGVLEVDPPYCTVPAA
jgi:hypothetical protein